jgi:hypothetical protein
MIKAQVEQAHYANRHRRQDHVPTLQKNSDSADASNNFYWLSTENLSSVPHRSRKWTPPYVGPFKCLSYDPSTSTYALELPARYTRRGISNVFHASRLRPFVPNDEKSFPQRLTSPVPVFPLDALEVGIKEIISHRWLPESPDDVHNLTKMSLRCKLEDGSSHDFIIPHNDIHNDSPYMVAYRHDLAKKRGKQNAYEHWRDFEKPDTHRREVRQAIQLQNAAPAPAASNK